MTWAIGNPYAVPHDTLSAYAASVWKAGRFAAHRVSGQGRINRLIVKRLDGEFSTAWD